MVQQTGAMVLHLLRERRFRMIWKIEGKGKDNYLAGTAHFFPHSFRRSLSRHIAGADAILLEGPLDEGNMEEVRKEGTTAPDGIQGASLCDALDPGTLSRLTRELTNQMPSPDQSLLARMDLFRISSGDLLRQEFQGLQPWMAFFRLWSLFLRKRGWNYSVDIEVYEVAKGMDKRICFLETIEEQLEALKGIPIDRIVRFFKKIGTWEALAREHRRHYLRGDLAALLQVTTEFPSRCASIVEKRDPLLFERALPFLEAGGAILCVGTIHINGISALLEKEGYSIKSAGEECGA